MSEPLDRFERITRSVGAAPAALSVEAADSATATDAAVIEVVEVEEPHPFESRNIHPDLPKKVRSLFDDGYWEDAVFSAFKFIEKEVKRISNVRRKVGFDLMMDVFNENAPKVQLNALANDSDVDEQRGYRHMFAGATAGIRNPRGHEVEVGDTPDEALDYLALASLLLRRLDAAGLR
ncbi:TIGR02391 family protein [Nocardioides marmoribigeumensis]|uniref:Uncharacterized protein (TIGR02391 family) n=1 Tax=Nocardioides marmoribigeumensis TaxID=433649 RepID=A0ABU2C082_9ACTN|nr:TIGR02391 family protein [Nocardioides marmoribigeumensis]MDR7364058.1 uncharacterized protein (TIGR02391 family) [Nocardioides marmoribigeumensis]